MLWADPDGDMDPGLKGGIYGALVTAFFAGLMALLKVVLPFFREDTGKKASREARSRRDSRDDAVSAYKDAIGRLEEHCERQQAVIAQQQQALAAVQDDSAECREDYAELAGYFRFLYDLAARHHATIRECGKDPGELPAPPPLRPRRHGGETEFLVRQAAQSAALAREAGKTVPKAPEAP